MTAISLRVPAMRASLRYRYWRVRNIVAAQFRRRTWAQRFYRLAVKVDGKPERYVRLRCEQLSLVMPQARFGPDFNHMRVLSGEGGEFTGNLRREDLGPVETEYGIYLDPNAKGWGFESLNFETLPPVVLS